MTDDKHTTSVQLIDFHGDNISTCQDERTSKVYCVPREIAEHMGMSWPTQRRKLVESLMFQRHTSRVHMNTPGGEQEVFLLDIDYLPAWLSGISLERVSPDARDKLLRYQEECAMALRDYWTRGMTVNPRTADELALSPWDMLIQMAEQGKEQARRLLMIEAEQRVQREEIISNQQQTIQANENAVRALEGQLFFTVAEYVYSNKLQHQVPENAYKAASDHLRAYCLDHGHTL